MLELARWLGKTFVEAVFPDKCDCGRWGSNLCAACANEIHINQTDLCPVCGRISPNWQVCSSCRHKSALTGVMILGKHEGVLKRSIWRMKYGYVRGISGELGKLSAERFGDFIRSKRFIVTWVPETGSKTKARGYNQAEILAKEMANNLDLKSLPLLIKTIDTKSQVGLKRSERLSNILGSISALEGPDKGRALVVDDVYTTGATLEECAKVLRKRGYREVWGLVLSRD